MNTPAGASCPSLPGLFDPNRDGHAEVGQAVQYVAADLRLGQLIGQSPSVKAPANDSLVSVHCRFDETASTISRAALPIDTPMLGNRLQMRIALGRRDFTQNRCRPRRDDDRRVGMTLRDSIIEHLPTCHCVVSSIPPWYGRLLVAGSDGAGLASATDQAKTQELPGDEAMILSRNPEFYRPVSVRNYGAIYAVTIRHRMPALH
jgi:hypothetical protein